MGSICSNCSTPEQKDDDALQKQLVASKHKDAEIQKLLLLGPGNSGKSTFLKQLLIIDGPGFSEDQLMEFTKSIFECIMFQMKMIIQQCYMFKYELPPEVEKSAKFVETMMSTELLVSSEVATHIKVLWNDQSIKESFFQRTHEGIADSAPYFF